MTGYGQMLLAYETFGYPDFLLATAGEPLDGQYADRPALVRSRPATGPGLCRWPAGYSKAHCWKPDCWKRGVSANDTINVCLALTSVDDVDDVVIDLLQRAL